MIDLLHDKVDLGKVKSIHDIAGCWVWQYGRWQSQWTWDRSEKVPYLYNLDSGQFVKGFKNILKFLEEHEMELEKY